VKPEAGAIVGALETGAALRPLRADDAEAIERWYDKAMCLAGSPVPLEDALRAASRRGAFALTAGTSPEPFGLAVVALDKPEPGWATVTLLAIAGLEQRDAAAGGVALLETRLRGEARDIRASMPLETGLALYFWLRLGYRPVASGGGLWMIRELEA
jgi:hypothetical protein